METTFIIWIFPLPGARLRPDLLNIANFTIQHLQ